MVRRAAMPLLRAVSGFLLLAVAVCSPSAGVAAGTCRLLEAGRLHEKAGRLDEAVVHYHQAARDPDCGPARTEFARLARRFAAEAEKQGRLYGETSPFRRQPDAKCAQCVCDGEGCEVPAWCETLPYLCADDYRIGADPSASAFAWLHEAGDYPEADRVLVQRVRSKPQDLQAFTLAHGYLGGKGSRGDSPPPVPGLLRELEGVAEKNGDALLREEEKASAEMLRAAIPMPDRVLERLHQARAWLAFVPGKEDKAAARAVQRGDQLAASEAPVWLQGAVAFYDFAEAGAKVAALRDRAHRLGEAAAKAGNHGAARRYFEIAGADDKAAEMELLQEQKREASPLLREKDDKARADFEKGKEALEKELDF
jgi:hypothetical protein